MKTEKELNILTDEAALYTIKNIIDIACPNGTPIFSCKIDEINHYAVATIGNKKLIFNIYARNDAMELLSGIYPLSMMSSADGMVQVPVMLKENLSFAQILGNTLIINADIVTLSFIMLSRYEETILYFPRAIADFDMERSIANKYKFIDIPIVDEYAMILRTYLKVLLNGLVIVPQKSKITPTHDIDSIRRFDGFYNSMKTIIGGDLLSRRSLSIMNESMKQYRKSFNDPNKDPLIVAVDKLIYLSKEFGLRSEFYFMGANKSKYNTGYDACVPSVHRLMSRIIKNNMEVGFHAGYETPLNADLFIEEKCRIEKALGAKILGGRQHYLRFDINKTYKIWQLAGMKYDSSLGYNEREGFRCGTCHEFHPWDFDNNSAMKIVERPLIAMDGTFWNYRKMSIEDTYNALVKLHSRCHAVEGNFIILWHNEHVFRYYTPWFKNVYERFLRNVT